MSQTADQQTPEATTPGRQTLVTTGIVFLGVIALMVLALEGLQRIAAIAAPVFLAFTLVLAVDPLRRKLVDKGVPQWVATIGMLVILIGILLTVVLGVAAALTQLALRLPDYQDRFVQYYEDLTERLNSLGVEVGSMDEMVSNISPSNVVPVVQGVLEQLGSVGMLLIFITLGMIFLTLDLGDGRRRLGIVRRHRPELGASLSDFARRIRKYWWISTIFSLIEASLNLALLLVLDVPLAFVWFLLAFLAGYIPNIGFVIGLVPAAALALFEHDPARMLGVIVGYMVINFVVKTLIMPKFAGDVVGLNVTTTFLSLVFWTIFAGPLGALLAIPLTLFAKAVLVDSNPRTRWLGVFMVASGALEKQTGDPDPPDEDSSDHDESGSDDRSPQGRKDSSDVASAPDSTS